MTNQCAASKTSLQDMAVTELTQRAHAVRLKTIALPAERGGWGFLFEPVALGLLLAPSITGLYLALSGVGFFLARQPLTLVMLNRKRESPRTAAAKSFALLYLGIGATSFAAALALAKSSFLFPLLLASPLAIVQVAEDWAGRRRVLLPEVAGVIAISSLAAAIALAGGWPAATAFALWTIVVARAVPSILYVRTMLARLHAKEGSPLPTLIAHMIAVALIAFFARASLVSWLAVAAMFILLTRAMIALRFTGRRRVTARQLGFSEIAFGAVTVFAVALGRWLGS